MSLLEKGFSVKEESALYNWRLDYQSDSSIVLSGTDKYGFRKSIKYPCIIEITNSHIVVKIMGVYHDLFYKEVDVAKAMETVETKRIHRNPKSKQFAIIDLIAISTQYGLQKINSLDLLALQEKYPNMYAGLNMNEIAGTIIKAVRQRDCNINL